MFNVIGSGLGVNQNVVQIDHYKFVKKREKDFVHEILKGRRRVT